MGERGVAEAVAEGVDDRAVVEFVGSSWIAKAFHWPERHRCHW